MVKRLTLVLLLVLFIAVSVGCSDDTHETEDSEFEGFEFAGRYITLDGVPYLIPDAEYRTKHGYDYLKLNIPPWVDGVSFDGITDGDAVIMRGATVFESDPPVLDVDGVDFSADGDISDVDAQMLARLKDALARLE